LSSVGAELEQPPLLQQPFVVLLGTFEVSSFVFFLVWLLIILSQYLNVTHSSLNHWKYPCLWNQANTKGNSMCSGTQTPPMQHIILLAYSLFKLCRALFYHRLCP
jgi:hypothetical protein